MKTFNADRELISLFNEQMQELRKELRERISNAEPEESWPSEVLDCIFTILQLDPATFHRIWMQPLLAAGLSREVAIACIADSYFLPN